MASHLVLQHLSNIIVNFDVHVLVSTNDCSAVEVQ